MLKQLLENVVGQSITQEEFSEVMTMATEDIKFNKIGFNKRTKFVEMLMIAERCATALKKCS